MGADLVPRRTTGPRPLEEIDAQLDALLAERAAQTSKEESIDSLVERFSTMLFSDSRTRPDLSFVTALRVVSDPEHVEAQSVQLLLNHLPHTTRVELLQSMVLVLSGEYRNGPADDLSKGEQSVFDRLATLTSSEVGRILSPSSAGNRAVAQKKRQAGELIGLPVGSRPDYRYPEFQLDRDNHKVKDLVVYANKKIRALDDPYGAASWWLTKSDLLDGRSPLEDLDAGDLTEIAIDNLTGVRGM